MNVYVVLPFTFRSLIDLELILSTERVKVYFFYPDDPAPFTENVFSSLLSYHTFIINLFLDYLLLYVSRLLILFHSSIFFYSCTLPFCFLLM